MSLNWNIEKIKDYQELQEDDAWLMTDRLIWLTLVVGLGEITEKNADEFYARVHLVELVRGAYRTVDGKPSYIKREDVTRRIGLSTNVSTKTRKQFTDQILKGYFAELVSNK